MGIADIDGSAAYLRNVLLKLTSGVVAFGASFVSGLVVARVLGAEGNGNLALLILVPTTIAFLGRLGIEQANGYLIGSKKQTAQSLLGNSLSLSLALTLLIGVVYWMAMPLTLAFLATDRISQPMLGLAFVLVPLSLIESYLYGILWGSGRFLHLSIVSIVRYSSLMILNVALVWVLRLDIWGAIVAVIASPAICVVIYVFFLRSDVGAVRLAFELDSLRATLAYGLQVHLGDVLSFLSKRLDVFIVNYFSGAVNVSFYVVATSLAELLWHLADAFGFVLFAKTASSEPAEARQFTPKVARVTAFVTAAASTGLFVASRWIIVALYTAEYLPSLYPLWILLPGVVALSYSRVIFSDLGGQGKPHYGTFTSLLTLVVLLVFDLTLIPRWGVVGAAAASSLAYVTNAVTAVTAYVRVTGTRLTDVLLIQRSDVGASLRAGQEIILAIGRSYRARRA
jgi:O-antigen/teichoic acid export membrane protein